MEKLPLIISSIFGVLIFIVLFFKDELRTTEDVVSSIFASSITSFIFFTIIYAFLSFGFFLWLPFLGV